jgi:hypothetical protein
LVVIKTSSRPSFGREGLLKGVLIMATGTSGTVAGAIADYKAAADAAAVQSLDVAKQVTEINGVNNAIKKISPS